MPSFKIFIRGEESAYSYHPTEEGALDKVVRNYALLNEYLIPEARVYREHIALVPMPEPDQMVQ